MGEGLISSNKDNRANFSGDSKFNEALRVVYFGENAKTLLVKSLSRSKLPITLAS